MTDTHERMLTKLRDDLTEVLYRHRWFTTDGTCHCGWLPTPEANGLHAQHQAEVLVEAGWRPTQ